MVFVDFHAHLDSELFDESRNDLIKKLYEEKIIVFSNTINQDSFFRARGLFRGYELIKVCPGLYPQDAEKITEREFEDYLKKLEELKNEFEVIGEVGLDKYNTNDEKMFEIQVKRFKQIIDFAIKLNKPLCIHTRKAEEEVISILEYYFEKYKFNKFNLHCFSGKKKLIPRIKKLGITCSIPLTIMNTESFQILVRELPINQILVETDSPYLNPSKEINTPLNVPKIYEKIAEIKGLNPIEVNNIIYRNLQKLLYL